MPWPADCHDHSASRILDVPEWQVMTRRQSDLRTEYLLHFRNQPSRTRFVVGALDRNQRVGGAVGMVEKKLAFIPPLEAGIDWQDVLENWRRPVARVFEEELPLDGWKVTVIDANAAHLETGLRIGEGQRVLMAVLVQFLADPLAVPVLQELTRMAAIILKGERRTNRVNRSQGTDGKFPQLDDLAIRHGDASVGPVGLVKIDTLDNAFRKSLKTQRELLRSVEIDLHRNPFHAFAHDLRAEGFALAPLDGANDAPTAGVGLETGYAVAVDPEDRLESLRRAGQVYVDIALGRTVKPAVVYLVDDLQRPRPSLHIVDARRDGVL